MKDLGVASRCEPAFPKAKKAALSLTARRSTVLIRALWPYRPERLGVPFIAGPTPDGQVAQLVEQRTENPRVVGSIPTLATIPCTLHFSGPLQGTLELPIFRVFLDT